MSIKRNMRSREEGRVEEDGGGKREEGRERREERGGIKWISGIDCDGVGL